MPFSYGSGMAFIDKLVRSPNNLRQLAVMPHRSKSLELSVSLNKMNRAWRSNNSRIPCWPMLDREIQ